jgi:hypothetical protein
MSTGQPRRDHWSFNILGVVLCLMSAGFILALVKAHGLPPATCTLDLQGNPIGDVDKGLPNQPLVALGVAAILAGHYFGNFRNTRWYRQLYPLGPRAFSTSNRAFFTGVMAIIFIGIFGALFYEALGVMRVPQGTILQPITYYIRCAIHYDIHPNPAVPSETQFPLVTVLLVVTLCFLFGHWLWYPAGRPRPAADGTAIQGAT